MTIFLGGGIEECYYAKYMQKNSDFSIGSKCPYFPRPDLNDDRGWRRPSGSLLYFPRYS